MDLELKCMILEEFSRDFTVGELDREFFSDFVIYNDLGLPLAQSVVYKLADLTEGGTRAIEETWINLCDLLELDPEEEYDGFEEMLDLFESDIDYKE